MRDALTPNPWHRTFVFGLFAFLWILQVCGCSSKGEAKSGPPAPPPAPVRIAEVVEQAMPVQASNVARVEALSTVSVKPQVSGELIEVAFKEGDVVEEGQKLFAIDPRPYKAALEQASANLAKADAALETSKANVAKNKAQAENARVELERDTTLVKKGMVSQSEYDARVASAKELDSAVKAEEANIRSAQEAIRASKAAEASARLELDYCTINAPIKGRTGSLQAYRGNIVKPGDTTPMVTITQTTPIYVSFTLAERYLWQIRECMAQRPLTVVAVVPEHEDTPIEGRLAFIENEVDQTTGTIRMKATFPNEDGRLWPGQYVNVTLQMATQENTVVVPAQAVQTGQNGPYTFVVTADLKAELRNVKTGETINGVTAILDGVKPGEKVITDGQLRVTNGSAVKLASEAGSKDKKEEKKPE